MADATETTAETPADDFADAFARLATIDSESKKDEEVPVEAAPAEEKPAEPVADDKSAEEPQAEVAAAPVEKPVEKTVSAPDPEADAILERLARLVKDQPQEVAPPQIPQQEEQIFTPDEMQVLQSYEKEWPDVAKAESLRRRAEYRELVSYVFGEVAKELKPLVESVQTISQRTHLSDLKSTVNDYDDVRDKVIDWVEQQPTYLQVAYKHVIENGTVDEVADLVNRYKRDSGVAATPAPAPAARKTETELPSATKQAAAALAPVSSKRSAVIAASDPEDFESAFASFASKLRT